MFRGVENLTDETVVPLQGAVLCVEFRLTRSDVLVRARAEVRYCLPGVGVGVEFVDISPDAQRAIEEEMSAIYGVP